MSERDQGGREEKAMRLFDKPWSVRCSKKCGEAREHVSRELDQEKETAKRKKE